MTLHAGTIRDALAGLKSFTRDGRRPPTVGGVVLDRVELHGDPAAGVVTIRRTDGVGLDATASVMGATALAGTVTVDADPFAAIVKAAKTVALHVDGDALAVTTDAGTATLPGRERLPDGYAGDWQYAATLALDELDALASVARVAAGSANGGRPILEAVQLDPDGDGTGTAVATDTYRLHAAAVAVVREAVRVPWRVLEVATRLASQPVAVTVRPDNPAYVRLAVLARKGPKTAPRTVAYVVQAAAATGDYPDWRALAPTPDRLAGAGSWRVTDAAGTATALGTLANRQNVPTILEADGVAVRAAATFAGGDRRTAAVALEADGVPVTVGVNPRYLADAVELVGDGAAVTVPDGLRAMILEGDGRYALVMPMRVG